VLLIGFVVASLAQRGNDSRVITLAAAPPEHEVVLGARWLWPAESDPRPDLATPEAAVRAFASEVLGLDGPVVHMTGDATEPAPTVGEIDLGTDTRLPVLVAPRDPGHWAVLQVGTSGIAVQIVNDQVRLQFAPSDARGGEMHLRVSGAMWTASLDSRQLKSGSIEIEVNLEPESGLIVLRNGDGAVAQVYGFHSFMNVTETPVSTPSPSESEN